MACHNHALFVRRHGQDKAIASPGQRTYHRTAGDTFLRKKHRTSRIKEKVILLGDARIQQI